jgi:hypothetical protein
VKLSHIEALTIFAALVSIVFAITTKSTPRAQVRYGVFVFFSFLAVAIVVGWIMYPLPF